VDRGEVACALGDRPAEHGGNRRGDQQAEALQSGHVSRRQLWTRRLLELPPGFAQPGVGEVVSRSPA
jgi:hypothetical protein